MLIINKPNALPTGNMTIATKRRLRRIRLDAAKEGVVIPYEGYSKPADPDAPKLTKTAKRMARQRKKYQKEMEAWLNNAGDMPTKPLSKPRTKSGKPAKSKGKKKKNVGDEEVSGSAPKLKKKVNEPGHIRFDESDQEVESVINKPVKKHSKKAKKAGEFEEESEPVIKLSKKRIKKEKESDEEYADQSEPVIKKSKKTKKEEIEIKEEVDEELSDCLRSDDKEPDSDDESGKVKINLKTAKPEGTGDKSNKPPKKRRFVLFVGNLSYETTEDQVREHFKKVGDILSIRLAKPLDDGGTNTCRGFGHLEVTDEESYLKALGLNHTFMGKRRINVEYSGSQTQAKKADQKKKNMKINALRKSGNMFEVMNPTSNPATSGNKTIRRNQAKRESQQQGNTFWV